MKVVFRPDNGIFVNGAIWSDLNFGRAMKEVFSLRGKETRSISAVIRFLDGSLTLRLLGSGGYVDV